MQLLRQIAFPLFLALLLACTVTPSMVQNATPSPRGQVTIGVPQLSPTVSQSNPPIACPITIPNGNTPSTAFNWFSGPSSHGNDLLWVSLWTGNKTLIRAAQKSNDGYLGMKFPWYRGVRGKLTIEGRRIDAPAPPLRASIPDGYGDSGFQSTGIEFPTEGCWQVTGKVGEASLTFVTRVVKLPFDPLWGYWFPEGLSRTDSDIAGLPKSFGYLWTSTKGRLMIETSRGARANTGIDPAATQQKITVNGQSGICAQGAFDAQQKWQNDADATMLEWSDGALSYRITQTGLGLTCSDLVRVATPS